MNSVEIRFECVEEGNDRFYRVSSVLPSPPFGLTKTKHILHESHYSDNAIKALTRAVKAAVKKQFDKITTV